MQGKVFVIVGGTTGLGRSAAEACLREGARVVVVGRSEERCSETASSLGSDVVAYCGDARNPATATQAIDLAEASFGGFDGLYHVAGGSGRGKGDGPLHELSDEGWLFTIEENLTTVFHSNRAAAAFLVARSRPGSILNMGSVLADSPSPQYFSTHAYAAAKAGIVGLTRSAAAFYAPQSIRFNVVAPALVETPMSQRAVADAEIRSFVETKQPLDGGRIGQPGDLDAAVVYLLSDKSKFVTGQVLKVDGGWSVSS